MRTQRLFTAFILLLLAAAPAAAQGPFSGSLFGHSAADRPERVEIVARVITTSAREKSLRQLFESDDAGRLLIKTDDLDKLLAAATDADELRVESTATTTAAFTETARIGDAAALETSPKPGALHATVRRPADGSADYLASIELAGPLGGFRATLTTNDDETAVFPLPGNFMTPAPAGEAGRPARAAYLAIQIRPARPADPAPLAAR